MENRLVELEPNHLGHRSTIWWILNPAVGPLAYLTNQLGDIKCTRLKNMKALKIYMVLNMKF